MASSARALEKRKRIWSNFTRHHLQSFHGLWARWEPKTGVAFDIHKSLREFREENGTVVHQNTHYHEGKDPLIMGPWSFTFEKNVLEDGFVHPYSTSSRGYFLPNGDGVWAVKAVLEGEAFFSEMYFCQGHIRASAACTYLAGTQLTRVALIREDTGGWPSPNWTTDVNMTSLTKLPEDWPSVGLHLTGREKTLTVDLEEVEGEMVVWKPPAVKAGYQAHCFPDGYMIVCPDCLPSGTQFEITVVCYTTLEGTAIRQITSFYNAQGQFTKMREIVFQ